MNCSPVQDGTAAQDGIRPFEVVCLLSPVLDNIEERVASDAMAVGAIGGRPPAVLGRLLRLDSLLARARKEFARSSDVARMVEAGRAALDCVEIARARSAAIEGAILLDFDDNGSEVDKMAAEAGIEVFKGELSESFCSRMASAMAGSKGSARLSLLAMAEAGRLSSRSTAKRLESRLFELNIFKLGL